MQKQKAMFRSLLNQQKAKYQKLEAKHRQKEQGQTMQVFEHIPMRAWLEQSSVHGYYKCILCSCYLVLASS